jgi:DNA-directed RNA polymerase alpha subunit
MNEFDSLPIGNPARRALAAAGIETLEDLTKISEVELLKLHGMGPKAHGVICESMKVNGLQFSSEVESERVSVVATHELPRSSQEKNKSQS